MAFKAHKLLSGKTTLAALVCLMVAVVGACVVLVRRAEAQAPAAANPVEFSPMYVLDDSFIGGGGNIGLNVHCLLPAVQNATTGFQLEASTPNGNLTYDVPIGGRTFGWYTTYLYHTTKTNGSVDKYYLVIWDQNAGTGVQRVVPGAEEQVALIVHPATRGNGKSALPISADLTIVGYKTDAYNDTGLYFPYEFSQAPYSK
jgi:hypothetical protein